MLEGVEAMNVAPKLSVSWESSSSFQMQKRQQGLYKLLFKTRYAVITAEDIRNSSSSKPILPE
jgi:hypothetical protein